MSLDTQIKQIKALLIKYDFFKMIGATLETPTNQPVLHTPHGFAKINSYLMY